MSKITCSCGQVNPEGTDICQGCGKPLTENVKNKQSILDMRYEGAARRSQTYNKSLIDKIWNFFSSVKVGVGIIVILLVSSSLGTFSLKNYTSQELEIRDSTITKNTEWPVKFFMT
nr:hypothetical protein [Thalassobacillus sp. C254]